MTKQHPRSLFISKLNDGLYHYIGAIYELELARLGWKGFTNYQDAITTRDSWGYSEFKTN